MIELNDSNICITDIIEDSRFPRISAYVETWFDVDAKFGTHVNERDDEWLNLYAIYDPVSRKLYLEYYIETDESTSGAVIYAPNESELLTIIDMMERRGKETYGMSCLDILYEET